MLRGASPESRLGLEFLIWLHSLNEVTRQLHTDLLLEIKLLFRLE